jgi:hypothetical protein
MCNNLVKLLKAEYYHFVRPEPGVVNIDIMQKACQEMAYGTVFDRFALSCFVYDFKDTSDTERVMTEWPRVTETHALAAYHHQKSKRNLLIFVTCDEGDLKDRFQAEGDANDYVTERELVLMSHLYNLCRERIYLEPGMKPDLMTINTSQTSIDQLNSQYLPRLESYIR